MLFHIIDRLKACKLLDKIIIVTTVSDKNNVIFNAVSNFDKSTGLFRVPEKNVLEMYYLAAKKVNVDQRISG